MSVTVSLNQVVEALDLTAEGHVYYVDKRTGEIILLTSEEMEAAEEDDLISEYPDWQRGSILKAREVLQESEQFSQLPDHFDVHEYKIMEDFCHSLEDSQTRADLLRQIKGSGAFKRFKNAIYSKGVEKAWYEFKQRELEKIAIEWLDEQEIPYSRPDVSISPKQVHETRIAMANFDVLACGRWSRLEVIRPRKTT